MKLSDPSVTSSECSPSERDKPIAEPGGGGVDNVDNIVGVAVNAPVVGVPVNTIDDGVADGDRATVSVGIGVWDGRPVGVDDGTVLGVDEIVEDGLGEVAIVAVALVLATVVEVPVTVPVALATSGVSVDVSDGVAARDVTLAMGDSEGNGEEVLDG
jgi:hypothetical protein